MTWGEDNNRQPLRRSKGRGPTRLRFAPVIARHTHNACWPLVRAVKLPAGGAVPIGCQSALLQQNRDPAEGDTRPPEADTDKMAGVQESRDDRDVYDFVR